MRTCPSIWTTSRSKTSRNWGESSNTCRRQYEAWTQECRKFSYCCSRPPAPSSVDQLTELTTSVFWDTRIAADRSREKLQPVRMLRARTPGPLPRLPSTAGVTTFLCCEESSLEEVVPMHDNARGKQRFLLRFKSAEAAAAELRVPWQQQRSTGSRWSTLPCKTVWSAWPYTYSIQRELAVGSGRSWWCLPGGEASLSNSG